MPVMPRFLRSSRARGWTLALPGLGLFLLGASPAGCGYTLAGRGSYLPVYIKTIGVPQFANRTTVFNAETLLTERVRSEFISRGRYAIVPSDVGVDALLSGSIASISLTPASFSATQQASRYTITMTVSIELRDSHTNTVLWDNTALVFREDYEALSGTKSTDPAAFFGQEANALDRVSRDFAQTIVSSILEAF